MTTQQLEIPFDRPVITPPRPRPRRNLVRARWWFARMHEAIERALTGRNTPPVRPDQLPLALGIPHRALGRFPALPQPPVRLPRAA